MELWVDVTLHVSAQQSHTPSSGSHLQLSAWFEPALTGTRRPSFNTKYMPGLCLELGSQT